MPTTRTGSLYTNLYAIVIVMLFKIWERRNTCLITLVWFVALNNCIFIVLAYGVFIIGFIYCVPSILLLHCNVSGQMDFLL